MAAPELFLDFFIFSLTATFSSFSSSKLLVLSLSDFYIHVGIEYLTHVECPARSEFVVVQAKMGS